MAEALPEGVTHWEGPGIERWSEAWRPEEAARRLTDLDIAWYVAGGWSIDLWHRRETRAHEDLEVAILRADFPRVRERLAELAVYSAGSGEVRALPDGALPPAEKYQNWFADLAADAWCVDVMLEPGDAETWVYRREPTLSAPRDFMIGHTAGGIPFLKPHGSLFFKSKSPRPKDDLDFASTLPTLDHEAKAWLSESMARFYPQSPWLERLK
jgi:hypothetical protein